jgi:hypothetical protein
MDVIAWVYKTCKFTQQSKVFNCKIHREYEIMDEGLWTDASKESAENHFMFSRAGRDRLKVYLWKERGWRCECIERPSIPDQPKPKHPVKKEPLLFDNTIIPDPFKR